MVGHQLLKALIIEKDMETAQTIQSILEKRGIAASIEPSAENGLRVLKGGPVAMAFAGKAEEGISPLELMRKIVIQSPMTSLILISELSEAELHDKAEGYGILGNIHPQHPAEGLDKLIDTFENIHQALSARK